MRESHRAALFHAVFEEAPDPMLIADDQRRYIAGNRAVRRFLGISRSALTASRIDDYTVASMRGDLHRLWATFLARGTMEGVFPILLPNGLEQTVLFRATANVRPGRHLSTLQLARRTDHGFSYDESTPAEVSFREREILTLLARGATINEIANETALSAETVRTHVRNAMRKLRAQSRTHAVALAMKHRYIDP